MQSARLDQIFCEVKPFQKSPIKAVQVLHNGQLVQILGEAICREILRMLWCAGIIVLPCGAGKTLVGITASARIRKSILCLVTNSVSVDQWRHQFTHWTNLQNNNVSRSVTWSAASHYVQYSMYMPLPSDIPPLQEELCAYNATDVIKEYGWLSLLRRRFTSSEKEMFEGDAGVMVTTYTMIAYTGRRSEESQKVMDAISSREWGLLLLDEVHVVPANMFRKVSLACYHLVTKQDPGPC